MLTFLPGTLIKVNEKLIQRPVSIYLFEIDLGYYQTDFFQLKSTGIVLDTKYEKNMTYTKIISDNLMTGWVRSVYLKEV